MQDIFEYKDCITPVKAVPSINVYGVDKCVGKKPVFTIAIPTYKRVATLSETIESALYQEGFDDYNVIVVDNNPERNDETEVFMQKYKSHPKVTYYKNSENVGMAGNMNKCILLSVAEKFVLLHDDDLISPYALKVFDSSIKNMDSFTLVKPELTIFSDKTIKFSRPAAFRIQKLSIIDFGLKCAVGAPSVILYDKSNLTKIGGFNGNIFPCWDYVSSLQCTLWGNTYLLKDSCVLGGYRIGVNESLNVKTMDAYFMDNDDISRQVLKKCGIKGLVSTLIRSAFWENHFNATINQYHMNDYTFNKKRIGIIGLPHFSQKTIRKIYSAYLRYKSNTKPYNE